MESFNYSQSLLVCSSFGWEVHVHLNQRHLVWVSPWL